LIHDARTSSQDARRSERSVGNQDTRAMSELLSRKRRLIITGNGDTKSVPVAEVHSKMSESLACTSRLNCLKFLRPLSSTTASHSVAPVATSPSSRRSPKSFKMQDCSARD